LEDFLERHSQQPDGDIHLMLRVKDGDHGAYVQIYKKYLSVVNDFLASLNCHHGLVEDLSQEVFSRVWQYRQQFKGNSSVKTYLFGLANNVLLEHLKRLSKQVPTVRNELLDKCLGYANALSEPEASAYNAELSEILRQTISQLPPKQLQALNLSYIEGKRHRQAATEADCSVSAFKNRRFLACKQLRGLLDHVKPE
jgi:RNA polymerase sigma-70 factor (ECF subfamily)